MKRKGRKSPRRGQVRPLSSGSWIMPLSSEKPQPGTAGLPSRVIHEVVSAQDAPEQMAERRQSQPERISWGQYIFDVPRVWAKTKGENVTVAVLDTGVDPDHPDLREAIADMRDFSGDGIEDVDGHGTHCAGVIAARHNDFGFVGVAPLSMLLIGKVLGNDGRGSYDQIADGIDWAVDRGAHIISMSLGGPDSSQRLFQSVHSALAAGVSAICAAGNEGCLFGNSIGYPGRYGGVITVAAHDPNGNPAGFSSRGGELDFMAPGTEIWSSFKDGGYASLSGTSMAAPFVAGLAALCISKHRSGRYRNRTDLNNCEDMREHLMRMATHPGAHDSTSGYGPLRPLQYF